MSLQSKLFKLVLNLQYTLVFTYLNHVHQIILKCFNCSPHKYTWHVKCQITKYCTQNVFVHSLTQKSVLYFGAMVILIDIYCRVQWRVSWSIDVL